MSNYPGGERFDDNIYGTSDGMPRETSSNETSPDSEKPNAPSSWRKVLIEVILTIITVVVVAVGMFFLLCYLSTHLGCIRLHTFYVREI